MAGIESRINSWKIVSIVAWSAVTMALLHGALFSDRPSRLLRIKITRTRLELVAHLLETSPDWITEKNLASGMPVDGWERPFVFHTVSANYSGGSKRILITRGESGELCILTNLARRIVAKGVFVNGNVVVFWSKGPDGIDQEGGGDDIPFL